MTEPVDPSNESSRPEAPQPYQAPEPYQPPTVYQAPQVPQAPMPYQPPDLYQPPTPQPPPGQLGYTPAEPPPVQAYGQPQPYPGQPYPSQPYQSQPYQGQPYAGQPYAGGGYPGQPYAPYAGYPPVPEPPRRRRKVIIAVAVVAAVGITIGVVATRKSGSHSTASISNLNLPAALGDYTLLPGATADSFRSTVGQTFGAGGELGKFFATATIGTYGEDSTPQLILIAAPSSKFPGLDASSLNGSGLSSSGIKTFSGGSNGGSVACFPLSLGSVSETVCFWSDSTTVGYLVAINTGESAAQLAAAVNSARDSLDH